MKRDLDLVRLILVSTEADAQLDAPGYTMAEILGHIWLMADAGLIDATFVREQDGEWSSATIHEITWEGHEFLKASRDSKLWDLAKKHVLKPGVAWSLQAILEFLKREGSRRFLGGEPPTP